MTTGFNLEVQVWRVSFGSDDAVGGAVITGTYSYTHVPARLQEEPVDHVFLQQQGIETRKTFRMMVKPSTLMIYDRDEVEITWPPEHRFYGDRFRVMGDAYTNFHARDPRGYLLLDLTRSERAHANQ